MPSYTSTDKSDKQPKYDLPLTVENYIRDGGGGEGGRNRMLFAAALQLRDVGGTQAEMEALLTPRALADGLEQREITHVFKQVMGKAPRQPPTGSNASPRSFGSSRNQNLPAKREKRKPLESKPMTPPDPIDGGIVKFLETIFREGEGVCISPGKLIEDEGRVVPGRGVTLSREEWLKKIQAKGGIEKVFSGKHGLFMRVNPMKIKGSGSDADVTQYRHALVEFDKDENGATIPKDVQYGAILASGLPVAAVLDSGSKSIHAWVRVDAANATEFAERVNEVYELFTGVHIDAANKNPSRLSRCVDGWRTVDGSLKQQKLLALGLGAKDWKEWQTRKATSALGQHLTLKELNAYDVANDPNNMIGHRWICKGGSLVLVSQSGVGKSSLQMQLAIGFALGRQDMTFGIPVVRPLKQLILQAENDIGDLAEAAQGVIQAFDLTEEEIETANGLLVWHRITDQTGADFVATAEALIRQHRVDVAWIDPLLNFIGDDVSDAQVVTRFCCEHLNPISSETGVIFALIHHTGKPAKATPADSNSTESDLAYAGLGSSVLTNWAREVMVLKRVPAPEGSPPTFRLTACKRRKRAGMRSLETGEVSEGIFVRHSGNGRMSWVQCEEPEKPAKGGKSRGGATGTVYKLKRKGDTAEHKPEGYEEGEPIPASTGYAPKIGGRPSALTPEQRAEIAKVKEARGGRLTSEDLADFASEFGVSRDTIRRA